MLRKGDNGGQIVLYDNFTAKMRLWPHFVSNYEYLFDDAKGTVSQIGRSLKKIWNASRRNSVIERPKMFYRRVGEVKSDAFSNSGVIMIVLTCM